MDLSQDGNFWSLSFLQTFPDPQHCSRYWDCYNGMATHTSCPWNFLYDPKNQWCDYPEKVYCGERSCDGRPCKETPDPIGNRPNMCGNIGM